MREQGIFFSRGCVIICRRNIARCEISFDRRIYNVHCTIAKVFNHRAHRVAIATFCTFHHDDIISPAWLGWGVHSPFHSIYHHEQSCGVQYTSSWEGRFTHPIISLPLYVLCGINQGAVIPTPLFSLEPTIIHSKLKRNILKEEEHFLM